MKAHLIRVFENGQPRWLVTPTKQKSCCWFSEQCGKYEVIRIIWYSLYHRKMWFSILITGETKMGAFTQQHGGRACGKGYGLVVGCSCILKYGHTGPHTDGNKQWSDNLESNFDVAKRESEPIKDSRCICDSVTDNHHHECPLANTDTIQPTNQVKIPQTMQCDATIDELHSARCKLHLNHVGPHDYGVSISQSLPIKATIETQTKEFLAARDLADARNALMNTPVVDDDYPEMRHKYESALVAFIESMKSNARFEAGNRYELVKL